MSLRILRSQRRFKVVDIVELRATLPISTVLPKANYDFKGIKKIAPSDSKVTTRIPLSDRSFFQRLKYRTMRESPRPGRILEDFDSIAVAASYKHNKQLANADGKVPLSIVTACVDEIRFFPKFHQHNARNEDLFLTGEVCWVGRSSMDVLCTVKNGAGDPLVESHFIMVARCPQSGKAAPVVQLEPKTDLEIKNYDRSADLSQERKNTASNDIFHTLPSLEETNLIHNLYRKTSDGSTESFASRTLPKNSVWMADQKLKTVLVCQPESRNIHNKIFGGWLMRQSVELAWITAAKMSGGKQRIIFIDDIVFKAPVEIGSVLMLHSQVIYSDNRRFQVRVRIEKRTPENMNEEGVTTNVMHLTFEADEPVPAVLPRSYGESMLYVTGKRHYDVQTNNYRHTKKNCKFL